MILRVAIANVSPRSMAERVQEAGLSATITESIGAGEWGIEPGVVAEFWVRMSGTIGETDNTVPRVKRFVNETLWRLDEESAYVTIDGKEGFLLHRRERYKPEDINAG